MDKLQNPEEKEESLNNDVPTLPMSSPTLIQKFITENRGVVYVYLLKMLKKAIRKDWPKVDLFRLGDTPFIAKIERKDYTSTLTDLMNYFTSIEDYEKATQCRDLINASIINNECR